MLSPVEHIRYSSAYSMGGGYNGSLQSMDWNAWWSGMVEWNSGMCSTG